MTENEAIKIFNDLLDVPCEMLIKYDSVINSEKKQALVRFRTAEEFAINALEERIAKKPDEYVPELLDDEIKLPYKISRFEAKAIKLALHHEWLRDTDDNGKAISCSQEMANATYKMFFLFDNLIKESDKDNERKEN